MQNDVKDDLEEQYNDGIDVTFFKYLNMPITAGLNYTYATKENLSLLGNFGLVLKVTNYKLEANNAEATIDFDLTTGFGFKVGGDILVNNQLLFELNYFGLGDFDVDGEWEGDAEGDTDINLEIGMVTLTMGFKF